MNKYWHFISNVGISDTLPYDVARKVRLLNQGSILCISLLLMFVLINIIFPRLALAAMEFSFAMIFALNLYLHSKKKFILASVLFIIEAYILVFLLCFIFSPSRKLEYILLVLSVFPIAIFTNKKLIYFLASLCAVLFMISKYRFSENEDLVSYLNGLMLFVLLFFIVKYLKDEHEGYRKIVEAQNFQLQKLNEEKNELIGIASHDLRSPLKRINGLLSLIAYDENKLTPNQQEIITMAQDVAKQNIEFVGKILDIESIENHTKASLNKVNIIEILKPLLKSFEPEALNKKINIQQSHGNEKYIALANEDYTKQVLENLISNSLKFSYPGSTIYISVSSTASHITISVKDQGQGLDEDDQKNLFKKFQRLSAQPTSGEHSSGLGLAIVKKYVDAMNGTIVCESKKGKGAEFIVQLPIAE